MNQTLNRKFIFHLLIILAIFTLDRVSKIYVINIAETTSTVDIFINDFLNIILVWNSGIGFGLFQFDERFAYNVITILILIINIVIIYLLLNSEKIS